MHELVCLREPAPGLGLALLEGADDLPSNHSAPSSRAPGVRTCSGSAAIGSTARIRVTGRSASSGVGRTPSTPALASASSAIRSSRRRVYAAGSVIVPRLQLRHEPQRLGLVGRRKLAHRPQRDRHALALARGQVLAAAVTGERE